MTPVYLNPPPLPFPLVKLKEEQHLQLFLSPQQAATSLSASTFLNSNTASHQDQTVTKPEESKPHDHKGNQFMTHEGSIDQQASSSSSLQSAVDQSTANGYNLSFSRKEDGDCESASGNGSSVKWMSSKVRLMKKMMNSNCSGVDDKPPKFTQRLQYPVHDSDETNSFSKANNTVRVCSDCNTTTTPLWRSGPRGPKSLCNACGIRQRKARRAMEAAAAAAAENGAAAAADASSMKIKVHIHKEKKSRTSHVAQCKKQVKPPYYSPQSQKKLCFKEFALSLSKNSALQRVFPQDVEDAAILLMELSCGLVHS
ncbi:PREDICTED: putative GATA transcription factor 22 [Theobroma cacao]|uniref:GATA transcription factor 22 n=1 Tax=Theobroma cacao TaxID=3641 RepID=A0AB32WWY9_THECC|nr:PREDICTED: putative GATA transcription factor 22 [Theobroma cacao]